MRGTDERVALMRGTDERVALMRGGTDESFSQGARRVPVVHTPFHPFWLGRTLRQSAHSRYAPG